MAQSKGVVLFAILSSAFLALVASVLLHSSTSTQPSLYCVSDTASYHITTLNSTAPRAKCFRVQDGIYTEVLETIPEANGQEIKYLDGWVLPGIIESHGHILQYGEMLESVSLYEADSMQEVRKRIAEFLEQHKGEGYGTREKWIRGIGWDQKNFGGVMPTAVSLPNCFKLLQITPEVDAK